MEREDQIFDMVLLNCNYIVMHILPNGAVEILITITVSGLVVVVRVMLSKVDSFFVVFREASRWLDEITLLTYFQMRKEQDLFGALKPICDTV